MDNGHQDANDDGGGENRAETDDDSESDVDVINYRGTIPRPEWVEFKTNVPRNITLPEKINELIREFNERQREDADSTSDPNNQDG